jgi:hypothetical protein
MLSATDLGLPLQSKPLILRAAILQVSIMRFASAYRQGSGIRNGRHLFANMLLFLCLGGCTEESPQLNSELIAGRFGSYGIEVIETKDDFRLSNLYSEEPQGRVCRTLALVRFNAKKNPHYAREHAQVTEGGSIGAVFKRHGWTIRKKHGFLGKIVFDADSGRIATLMRIELPARLSVDVYVLEISRNGQSFDYAMIAEVHHPDYLTARELLSLYGDDRATADYRQDVEDMLELVRSEMFGPFDE